MLSLSKISINMKKSAKLVKIVKNSQKWKQIKKKYSEALPSDRYKYLICNTKGPVKNTFFWLA